MPNAGVAGDPSQGVEPAGIGRQRLEQVMGAVSVNLVKADEQIRFAMGAGYVPRRQDLHPTATIPANYFLSPLVHLACYDRIRRDKFLGEIEVVSSLTLVIGKDETIVPLRRRPDQQPVQCGQDQVSGLPVLFRPAADREIVLRPVTVKLIEHRLEDGLSI